jgi:hypothetical protein
MKTAKKNVGKKSAGAVRSAKKTQPARGPLAPERVNAILKGLDEAYPEAVCARSCAQTRIETIRWISAAYLVDSKVILPYTFI